MFKKLFAKPHALAFAAVASLALTACGGTANTADGNSAGATGEPVTGGELVVQIPTDPQALDVIASPGPATGYTVQSIFEKLFQFDSNLEVQPGLVDEYEVSEDNLTYTFKLRSDVKFHDGDTLDSEDVVASLNRWMEGNPTGMAVGKDLDSLEATDELTVTLKLTKPRYALESELAFQGAEIYKAEVLERVGSEGVRDVEDAIGTGPYKVVEWNRGQEIVTERFDEYTSREEDWGGYAGAREQYVDSITYEIVSDQNAIANGLQSGQWHIALPGSDQFEVLEASPAVEVQHIVDRYINVFVVNQHEDSAFAELDARHALNKAMDKNEIIAATNTGDLVTPGSSFAPETMTQYYSEAGRDIYEAHDPDAAKEYFDTNLDGETLRIITTSTFPAMEQMAVVLQDQLSEIGVKSEVDVYDYPAMLAMLTEQPDTWDVATIFFNGSIASPSTMTQVNFAFGSYDKPELQQVKDQFNAATSDEEAAAAVDAIQQHIWDDLPFITVGHELQYAAHTTDLQGYEGHNLAVWNSWLAQ